MEGRWSGHSLPVSSHLFLLSCLFFLSDLAILAISWQNILALDTFASSINSYSTLLGIIRIGHIMKRGAINCCMRFWWREGEIGDY